MMWPRGGLLSLCLATLFAAHGGNFAVTSGGPLVMGAAAASVDLGLSSDMHTSHDHAAVQPGVGSDGAHATRSLGGAEATMSVTGGGEVLGGRRLLDVCHTRRCD